MKLKFFILVFLLLALGASNGIAQAPAISYASPQLYTLGAVIPPLSPANTGGAALTAVTLSTFAAAPTGMTTDVAGNLYITDFLAGTVLEVPATGGPAVIIASGLDAPAGIACDAAGNLFVTNEVAGTVSEIAANTHQVTSRATGFTTPFGITVDVAGNLFVTDLETFDAGAGQIKEVPAGSTGTVTVATGLTGPSGVAVDAAGNIFVAEASAGQAIKISATDGSVKTLVTGLRNPLGIALDASDNIYIADQFLGILKIPATGGITETLYNSAVNETGAIAINATGQVFFVQRDSSNATVLRWIPSGGYAITPALPKGLTIDENTGVISGTPAITAPGKNYTVTAGNASGTGTALLNIAVNLPSKPIISYSTPQVYTAKETITLLSPTSSGGIIPSAGAFSVSPALPAGLAFNINTGAITGTPTNAVAAADYTVTATNLAGSGTAIVNITVNAFQLPAISYSSPQSYRIGAPITPLSPSSSFVDAAGYTTTNLGTFSVPEQVAVDAAGNVYVVASETSEVDEIPADGSPTISLGSGFSFPGSVAVDAAGNVYVLDRSTVVKKIPAGNGAVVTIASGFLDASYVAVDAAGNLYVSDNGSVKKIAAGTSTPVVIGTGFYDSPGMAVDAAGNVYVTNLNGAIKEILAGTGATVTLATPAEFPQKLAADASGNVYFVGQGLWEIPAGTHTAVQLGVNIGSPISLAVGVGDPNIIYTTTAGINGQVYRYTPAGGYFITPALPAGLTLSSSTGIISGIPATLSPATNYTVKAYNQGGSSTAQLKLTVYSNNAGLANLAVSNGTLSPAFVTATANYTANVGNTLDTFTVTPTTADSAATVTVNGAIVTSGSPSANIPLSVGANAIKIIVTAQDGVTTQTYTLVVNKAQSQNADLSNITLSSGTVSPVFVPAITNYTAIVDNSVSSITLTPTVSLSTSTVTVNGAPVTSGSPSASIPLTVGTNIITITGTAQNGTTKTYTLSVTRSSNVNVYLSSLAASNGVLIPNFSSGETVYNVYVGNLLTTMTLTPTSADPAATITVNGSPVNSGSPSSFLPLAVGTNAFHVVVTGSDGTTTLTYTVIVHESKSEDNYLASLTTSSGFAQGLTVPETMKQMVLNEPNGITLTPTVRDPTSTVTVNGAVVSSGSASARIPLTKGANTITIIVTAQDQSTRTYLFTIAPVPSSNADLTNIRMNKGMLSPAFDKDVLSYQDTVTNGTTSIAITPVAANNGAIITVNGTVVPSGKQSGPIFLVVGLNTITTVVSASDGITQKTYTVYVLRPSKNTQISYLNVYYGGKDIFNWVYYYVEPLAASANYINSGTAEVNAWLEDSTATMTVNGVALPNRKNSAPIAVTAGTNIITIVVTAQDKVTTRIYTFTLNAVKASGTNIPDAELGVDKPTETPQLTQDGITVHQGISPNGDGINDFLQIDNIANYPDNKLSIMNRNGALVYEARGYDNATKVFDGHSNKTGQMQLPGTYFYELDYTVRGVIKHKTGFLVLKY